MKFPFFNNTKSTEKIDTEDEVQKLIQYTREIITREDIVTAITDKYSDMIKQTGTTQITGYIQLYLALEQFIINNKPLIVKKSYTKELLREEIATQIKLALIPEPLRMLFLPGNDRFFFLYKDTVQRLTSFLAGQAGTNKTQLIIEAFNKSYPKMPVTIEGDRMSYSALQKNIKEISASDLVSYFKMLIYQLYKDIASSFGENAANDLIKKEYEPIKERYDYDIITDYLKVIPDGILDKERIAFMTREDLESQARQAVEERIRRETLEKSSKDLVQTVEELQKSKDTVVSLLNESQKLEKDLRVERDRVNAIISSMNEGLFVVNTDYEITLINHSAVNLLHLPEEGFLGRDVYNLFPIMKDGKILDKPETPLATSLTTGKTVIADVGENLYYAHPNGLNFPIMVSTAPLFDAKGTIVGAVLVFRDISETLKYEQAIRDEKNIIEQKVAEQTKVINQEKEELQKAMQDVNVNYIKAQKSEARLLASIKNLTIGFIATHNDESISSINNAAKTLLGITSDTVTIEDIDQKLNGVISLKEKLSEVRDKKTTVECKECQLGEMFFHIVITPVLLAEQNQEYIGSVIILEDITESKALEKTKDEFFAIASHDLRTPLTAIRGYISLIQTIYKEKITDPSVTEIIGNIDLAAIRLIDLVNEYLNVTRLDNGKLKYISEDIILIDLLNETAKEIETLASKKNIYLHVENTVEQPFKIYADREKMKQVFSNLLGNAIKFTDKGGITISISRIDDTVEVRIIDTGKGIPKAFQDRLFKKFQLQGANSYVRDNTQGSGLGLYISRRLIENMHGTITLEHTEENKGSTFLMTLPIKK